MAIVAACLMLAGCGTPTPGGVEGGVASGPSQLPLRFVVLSDNQPEGTGELGQPDVFKRIVAEVRERRAACVINCGDEISGYTGDAKLIGRMWDEYLEVDAGYRVPSHHVPGNHDIWDDQSAALFEARVGKPTYSFDEQGGHFIVLNSEDQRGSRDEIAGAQLVWLKQDLEAHRDARCTFVFLHKPLWLSRDWQTYRKSPWNRDIHPLLKQYGVTAVFAGHWHNYSKSERDGIRYYVVPSAGGPIGEQPDTALGQFFGCCLVTASGGKMSVEVVMADGRGSLDEDAVRYENLEGNGRADALWNQRAKAWELRSTGRHAEAAAAWRKTVPMQGDTFANATATALEEIEEDLRASGALASFPDDVQKLCAVYEDAKATRWGELTAARVLYELGHAPEARRLQAKVLNAVGADEASVGQVYHDLALGRHRDGAILVEGEDFVDQGGGRVRISDNKVHASGKSFSGWDNPGHWLEWSLDVPRGGDYWLLFRFAEGFQDEEGTKRMLTLDGEPLGEESFWFTGGWSGWADDWHCKLFRTDDGEPRPIRLPAGKHRLRLEASDGKPRGLNIDYFLLVPPFERPEP